MKFREHRGGLAESMATVKDYASLKELEEFITQRYPASTHAEMTQIMFDDRIGWDTYLVAVRENDGIYSAIGFSDGFFEPKNDGKLIWSVIHKKV